MPDDRGLTRFLAGSVAVHVVVFAFALGWETKTKNIQPVYNVKLVTSVPGGGPRAEKPVAKGKPEAKSAAPKPAKPAKKEAVEKPAPKPVKKAEPKPAPKPAPVKKAAAKPQPKPDPKPAPEPAKAAQAQEPKASDTRANLDSALAGVEDLIKKGSASGHEGVSNVGGDIAFGGGQGGAQAGALAEQIYAGQIQVAIQRNWQLPGELANRRIKVVLGLRIGADGAVQKVWVDEPSGVSIFDETAMRAVRAASPLPAPPATTNGYYEVYPRFTPADATRSP